MGYSLCLHRVSVKDAVDFYPPGGDGEEPGRIHQHHDLDHKSTTILVCAFYNVWMLPCRRADAVISDSDEVSDVIKDLKVVAGLCFVSATFNFIPECVSF